jgi:hypothetical protein
MAVMDQVWKDVNTDEDDEGDYDDDPSELEVETFRTNRHHSSILPEIHEQINRSSDFDDISNPARESNIDLNEIISNRISVRRNWVIIE